MPRSSYTGTRDLNTVLTTGVASGVLPDLAGLPGPGQMAEWADSLHRPRAPCSTWPPTRPRPRRRSSSSGTVNGKLVGVFIKTAVKGLIWYNPKVHRHRGRVRRRRGTTSRRSPPPTRARPTPTWCMGVESGAASGWPATDWIEDIVLRQAGPDVYNSWWQGKTKWTDPAIKAAFQTFGDVVANAYGGSEAVDHHQLRGGRRPAVHVASGLPAPPPGQLHHRPRRVQDHSRRHRLQLLPVPRHRPGSSRARSRARATCSACSTTRRRPSR